MALAGCTDRLQPHTDMPDLLRDAGTPERTHIDVNDEGDVEYWAHRLGVTRQQVVDAVRRVGDCVPDVERALAPLTASGRTPD
jgi:hypothetical protein